MSVRAACAAGVHVCSAKGRCFGTALRKSPACGCDTETRRAASRRETLDSRVNRLCQAEWWMIDE